MNTIAEQLAAFAVQARDGALPDDVRASVRQRVLDIAGISLAALSLDTSQAVIDFAREQGGSARARAIGSADRLPANQAAFVGGVLAHSLDYDDTHLPSILHPSASVIPAALAAAQSAGRNGADLIAAIAAGIEITVRLGMAGYVEAEKNSIFFERGQHATSICGAVGSAAAAALLYGADADGVMHAMGIAASMASGIIEANRGGGTIKRMHCGWAAHAGVTAAELGARGITGPATVFEGRFGFFEAFLSGRYDAAAITDELGARWEVPGIFFKPYPANHFTHAGIDAALALRARGVAPADIESITLGVAGPTVRTIGEPLEDKRAPKTGYQAQFSGPYTVAAALIGGGGLGLGLDDFTDELAVEPQRRALAGKVTVTADQRCEAIYPHQFPAVLQARLRDGSTLTEEVLTNRGGPQRPLSDEELNEKFSDNARRALGAEQIARTKDATKRLAELTDVSELLDATVKE